MQKPSAILSGPPSFLEIFDTEPHGTRRTGKASGSHAFVFFKINLNNPSSCWVLKILFFGFISVYDEIIFALLFLYIQCYTKILKHPSFLRIFLPVSQSFLYFLNGSWAILHQAFSRSVKVLFSSKQKQGINQCCVTANLGKNRF